MPWGYAVFIIKCTHRAQFSKGWDTLGHAGWTDNRKQARQFPSRELAESAMVMLKHDLITFEGVIIETERKV